MEPLTEEEVHRAIFAASLFKAPGNDGMPAVVWQELWEVLRRHIVALYQLSLERGKLPLQWKTATIIPLKKGGTRDFRSNQIRLYTGERAIGELGSVRPS